MNLLLGLWIGCQAFDGTSTIAALRNDRIYEGNSLMRGSHLIPVKVGVNVGALIWQRKIKGKNKLIFPLFLAGAGCTAGALNIRAIRSLQ